VAAKALETKTTGGKRQGKMGQKKRDSTTNGGMKERGPTNRPDVPKQVQNAQTCEGKTTRNRRTFLRDWRPRCSQGKGNEKKGFAKRGETEMNTVAQPPEQTPSNPKNKGPGNVLGEGTTKPISLKRSIEENSPTIENGARISPFQCCSKCGGLLSHTFLVQPLGCRLRGKGKSLGRHIAGGPGKELPPRKGGLHRGLPPEKCLLHLK